MLSRNTPFIVSALLIYVSMLFLKCYNGPIDFFGIVGGMGRVFYFFRPPSYPLLLKEKAGQG